MKIFAARWYPTKAGKSKLEPASGTNPSETKGIENFDCGSATTTSQWSNIVVPTPIAFPLTAAKSGFGNSRMAAKNAATVESSDVGG